MSKKKTPKKVTTTVSDTKKSYPKLLNVFQISRASGRIIWKHKKLLAGITLIYGLLNLILVQGLAATNDVGSLKEQLNQVFTGELGSLAASFSVFVVLVGSTGSGSSQTAGAYQFFLALVTSLAIIWALRQIYAHKTIRVRDAFYNGMTPLIPFVLMLLIIGIQLLPLLIGSTLYSIVMTNGIAVSLLEQLLWLGVFLALALASLYMITSSLIALYITTLPDMTPITALRSAKNLVAGRRWIVMRKLLFLPPALFIFAATIMLPIILFLAPLAQWIFFVLTMFALVAVHTYIYTVYRELLRE